MKGRVNGRRDGRYGGTRFISLGFIIMSSPSLAAYKTCICWLSNQSQSYPYTLLPALGPRPSSTPRVVSPIEHEERVSVAKEG